MDAAILLKKYLHWRFDKKNGLHGCVNLSQAGKKNKERKPGECATQTLQEIAV